MLNQPQDRYSSFYSESADGQFLQFLEQEISDEKKELKSLPKISGFIVETNGSDVKLTKKAGGEL